MSAPRFEIGQMISFTMLYGGHVMGTVIERSREALTLREKWVAEDTGEYVSANSIYPIFRDGRKGYIEIWEYHGEKGVVYAEEEESV